MMNRYNEWTHRTFGLPPPDIWRLVPKHPATEWVRSELTRLGRGADDDDVAFYLNRSLIQDVLHAAGAAEYTADKVHAAIAAVEDYVENTLRPTWPDPDLANSGLVHPLVDYSYIEWNSFLEKLRTLMDRVRSDEPRAGKRGLIPALKVDQDPRIRIETAFDRLTKALTGDRSLTIYSLHLHALPNVSATARIERGRLVLPVPDVPAGQVYIFDQLTWHEERDVFTFTSDRMAAVELFIDEMLAAIEAAGVQPGVTSPAAQTSSERSRVAHEPCGTGHD